MGLPAMILLLASFMHSVLNEMQEAVKIDGCGYFHTVFSIAASMSRPVFSVNLIIGFISSRNDMPPMPLTGILVATIPAILIHVFLQKQIIMDSTDGPAK